MSNATIIIRNLQPGTHVKIWERTDRNKDGTENRVWIFEEAPYPSIEMQAYCTTRVEGQIVNEVHSSASMTGMVAESVIEETGKQPKIIDSRIDTYSYPEGS